MPAEYAGVAATADPVSGRRYLVVIDAAPRGGHGSRRRVRHAADSCAVDKAATTTLEYGQVVAVGGTAGVVLRP